MLLANARGAGPEKDTKMADTRRRTEVANRSRVATWMRRVDKKTGGATVTNLRSTLRATGGEQVVVRARKPKFEYAVSTRLDASVGSHAQLRSLLRASGGEQQISSEFGRWETKVS